MLPWPKVTFGPTFAVKTTSATTRKVTTNSNVNPALKVTTTYSCTGTGKGNEGCLDVDKCQKATHNCTLNAACSNVDGGYTCECVKGFTGNGYVNCTNIDKCTNRFHDCDENQDCVDISPGFVCDCMTGFIDNENGTCVDFDECNEGIGIQYECDPNANFTNFHGSFKCTCNTATMVMEHFVPTLTNVL